MAKSLYCFLVLALMAQLACSAPKPTMTAPATPVFIATPELITSLGPANTPTWTPTAKPAQTLGPNGMAIPPGPTATAIPENRGTTARPPAAPVSPEANRETLAAFYEATGGPGWRKNANWLGDAPIGEWYGATTDGDGRITFLSLWQNGLSGQIPSQLGNLSNLTTLSLEANRLSGEIPSQLGNLSDLQTLFLNSNRLSGEIPSQLGNLSNLEELTIADNQLSGEIPSQLGNLSNLMGFCSRLVPFRQPAKR